MAASAAMAVVAGVGGGGAGTTRQGTQTIRHRMQPFDVGGETRWILHTRPAWRPGRPFTGLRDLADFSPDQCRSWACSLTSRDFRIEEITMRRPFDDQLVASGVLIMMSRMAVTAREA